MDYIQKQSIDFARHIKTNILGLSDDNDIDRWSDLYNKFQNRYVMTSKELRIGNKVKQAHATLTVTGIFINECICTDFNHTSRCSYQNLEPIRITEKWLKDFGFKYNNPFWEHQNLNLELFKRINVNEAEELVIPNKKYAGSIKYIHELQNLYYTLVGEELAVTPK